MTFLDSNNAFSAGADLWVVGPLEESSWALQIDWLLNFQRLKSTQQKQLEIAPQLQNDLAQSGWASDLRPPALKQEDCLLIPAEFQLPCRWIYCLAGNSSTKLLESCGHLKISTVRLFAYGSWPSQTMLTTWEKMQLPFEVQIVKEEKHL